MKSALAALRAVAACVILIVSVPAWDDFRGEVVRILDGDTIDVLVNRQTIRVRLADIDAPESGQAFGSRARQRLAGLTFRQEVQVTEKEVDRYGRTLGVVYAPLQYPGGQTQLTNINAIMVQEGMAWAYRYYGKPTDAQMYEYEKEARRQRLGLWSDPNAQEPWKWRRASKNATN